MSTIKLMRGLQSKGVKFSVNGDQLTVKAPKDSLSRDTLSFLPAHKQELIAALNARDVAKPPPPKPVPPAPSQARLPLPVLTCSNCGSSKLEPKVYTMLCLSCGQIDERCPGCDALIRDSDVKCMKCGRVLV